MMNNTILDQNDKAILNLLQTNARLTNKEIAGRTNRSLSGNWTKMVLSNGTLRC